MLPTYSGIMRDNRIEWSGDEPASAPPGQAIRVFVPMLEGTGAEVPSEQGREMAAILEQLAAQPANEDLGDPLAWQREVRQDRPLPDRDE